MNEFSQWDKIDPDGLYPQGTHPDFGCQIPLPRAQFLLVLSFQPATMQYHLQPSLSFALLLGDSSIQQVFYAVSPHPHPQTPSPPSQSISPPSAGGNPSLTASINSTSKDLPRYDGENPMLSSIGYCGRMRLRGCSEFKCNLNLVRVLEGN